MNCKDMQEFLLAKVNGELEGPLADLIDEHITHCAECRNAMAEYEKTREKLLSLRMTPEMPEIKEAIMAKLNREQTLNPFRRWLKPVGLAVPVIIILALFVTLDFGNLFTDRDDVIAKAYAAGTSLVSFKYISDSYNTADKSAETVLTRHSETEYSAPNNFRLIAEDKQTTLPFPFDRIETIRIDDQVYVNTPTTYQLDPSNFDDRKPSEELTIQLLNVLDDTDSRGSEVIDGVDCYHYFSSVNMDKYLELQKTQATKSYYRMDANLPNGMAQTLEEWLAESEARYRTQDITFEFWIGKDDYLIRQSVMIYQTREGEYCSWNSYRLTTEARYFDFNEEIVIEAPLDEAGNILPGWSTYTMTEQTIPEEAVVGVEKTEISLNRIPVESTAFPAILDRNFVQIEPVTTYQRIAVTWEYLNGEFQPVRTFISESGGWNQYHSKAEGTDDYKVKEPIMGMLQELVFKDNKAYTAGLMTVPPNLDELNDDGPTVEETLQYIDLLYNIEILEDAVIDGTDCYHIRGVLDTEPYLEWFYPEFLEAQKISSQVSGFNIDVDAVWKTWQAMERKVEKVYEYWIGKDDYLVRKQIITQRDVLPEPLPAGDTSDASTRQVVIEYFNLNQPVEITEPVDENGNVLDGWTLTILE